MKKGICFLLLLLIVFTSGSAQVQSPDDFLGYKIGTRFTPHHKIVSYFQQIATASPSMVKLETYGTTYEGRPLVAAFISREENMDHLEDIRINNLRLANMALDDNAPKEQSPAIVWLSYNVHGNEASSSEAAMLTLYELVNPANAGTKEWLRNTVVVIDPCVNPDGRDRYINWFNSVAGKTFNPRLSAREHHEPWPGGRTNHYYFDLNRDWAWQSLAESQQRMKLYRQWYPQIHADFHEQGINSPYYFAPAAQPYHEAITSWQRDFQRTIGKNHARYFDANGWLFFTREVYDLYYPSYGDTYPIYTGAIGMTYEQAGGGSSGLGVYKEEGDTLTLGDRVLHHFTTGMSTIEIAAENSARLIGEYHRFFKEALSKGTGLYKTYVIRWEDANTQRIAALLELLDKNNIRYGTGKGSAKGYHYLTGREESFTLNERDIVISGLQPMSTLLSVLFEPKSKLVDSATYDITAWALPYVYGVSAYAVKEKINMTGKYPAKPSFSNPEANPYGYVIPWEGIQSARAVARLMRKGVKLRMATADFETNGMRFKAGAVIVVKMSNGGLGDQLWKLVVESCNQQHLKAYPVSTGFSDKGADFGSQTVKYIKAPKIALAAGPGTHSGAVGEAWFFIERTLDYPVTLIDLNDLTPAHLNEFDVLVLPDGQYPFLKNNKDFADLESWINKGGKLIAMENAVAQLAAMNEGIQFKKEEETEKRDEYDALKKYEDRERDLISSYTPGSIYKVHLDNSHPLAFGYPDYYFTLKMDDHVYEFISEGWNVGVIKKENLVAGFVGSELKKRLNDGVIYGVQDFGKGNIIYLADNVLFRNFWENGKLMFCNALFLVGH